MYTTISYIEPCMCGDIQHKQVADEDVEGHVLLLEEQGWTVLGTQPIPPAPSSTQLDNGIINIADYY